MPRARTWSVHTACAFSLLCVDAADIIVLCRPAHNTEAAEPVGRCSGQGTTTRIHAIEMCPCLDIYLVKLNIPVSHSFTVSLCAHRQTYLWHLCNQPRRYACAISAWSVIWHFQRPSFCIFQRKSAGRAREHALWRAPTRASASLGRGAKSEIFKNCNFL